MNILTQIQEQDEREEEDMQRFSPITNLENIVEKDQGHHSPRRSVSPSLKEQKQESRKRRNRSPSFSKSPPRKKKPSPSNSSDKHKEKKT